MLLRNVVLEDVDAYIRMRCDPGMMKDLGGPLPREGMAEKVQRDVRQAAKDTAWIKMIIPEAAHPSVVAGTVCLWSHEADDQHISEIGWMVLPAFQGRGYGKRAVRALLEMAKDDGRWGLIHAYPATSNLPSNGICRAVGFTFVGEQSLEFADRVLDTHHWVIDPSTDPVRP
ncbi:GNAT family N-acetyltransferase [Streptomyces sp. NBC_00525]|uniref:GNAT family N-acetyltransferase n=1 Tax=Streptomyces sp. NBC_00525 TaxID=2903660 RepID=UPI002E813444|nr:GNAT family N-acetyltransferase [Streptomyces sp. NBC_00525]WUC96733.1 GNAT family N-acetyltransferase [Streptomyces sp. NBC_00525]